jgi:hypothetical protein
MLWVTMTMVNWSLYSLPSSPISSSMRVSGAAILGSSAEQGSSSSSTSGSTAMARAMHQALLLAARQAEALSCRRSFTSSHSAAPAALFSTASSSTGAAVLAVHAQAVGDVLVDRLRERVGLLEHHADAPAQLRDVDLAVEQMSLPSMSIWPSMRTPSMRSFMRLKQRSSVDLPQPLGPMKAVTCRAGCSSSRRAAPASGRRRGGGP